MISLNKFLFMNSKALLEHYPLLDFSSNQCFHLLCLTRLRMIVKDFMVDKLQAQIARTTMFSHHLYNILYGPLGQTTC